MMKNNNDAPIELWTDWRIFKGENTGIIYSFNQQIPPDGIYVNISIRKVQDSYEVWSISEHRVSGPYENLAGTAQTLEKALTLAEKELRDWEAHLLGSIKFYRLKDEYGYFSNFAHYPIELKGKTWPTSEHYFQAQKFAGTEYEEEIRLAKWPSSAARIGREDISPKSWT